jgi:hypothetical protein
MFPMRHTEEILSLMHASQPHSMSPFQRALHAVQDACRRMNGRDTSCDSVRAGISGVCEQCRVLALQTLHNESRNDAVRQLEECSNRGV